MLKTTSKVPGDRNATATGETGMRPLTRRLLSSSAAPVLALAFAATVSTTIFTPAHAIVACTINDTGAPWTIDCPPGPETALNPNSTNNGWPGTNDYTSGNQGIVVTVEPGATVGPLGGTWYFGNSGNTSVDDGGPFVFTLGSGNLAQPTSNLTGDIMIGGNIQLTTNSANFTTFGNITGSVGLGVGNLPQSRMGGPVTFYNGPVGVIGGSVTVYSGITGAGPSGTQNFNNVGTIGGGVLLDTAGSVVIGCSTSSNLTGNTIVSTFGNGTTNVVNVSTSTSADTFTTTHNGGFISATNTGSIGGPVNISANDGAYQNNSGSIAGPVNVIDSVDNSWSSSTEMSVSTSQQSYSTSTTTSGNGQTVTFTASSLGGIFGGSSETVNWSNTVYSSIWSAGNMATLINTGTIGNLSAPTTVVVNGDTGASATNGPNATIFGDVTVTSINRIGNSTSTWQGNDLFGPSFSSVPVASASSSDVIVFSPSAGNATASYVQSSFSAFGETSAHSWTFTNSSTTNYLGGNASFANNGNITGGVTVVGVDSAALSNTGFIADPVVTANLFNLSSTSTEVRTNTSAENDTFTYSIASTPSGNIQTFGTTTNFSTATNSSDSFFAVSMAVGGTATLTNTGNIGAGATVTGQALALVNNSGVINGFVNVSADNYTYGSGYSFGTASASQSADSLVTLVNTGGNSTMGAPGTTLSVASTFSAGGSHASFEASSYYYVIAAGTAIVNNSGNITGPVTVEASGNATLVNSGHILDPFVAANWNNQTFAESSLSVESSSFVGTSNYSLNTADSGNLVQSFVTSSVSAFGSSGTLSSTSAESTTHGVASLINSGNATIGNATTFVPVTVIGQASASLNNSGTIFTNGVLVSAVEFASNSSVTDNFLVNRATSAVSFEFVNTGGNSTSGAAGFLTLSGFSFGSQDAGSVSYNSSEASTTTGGNASLINSGNITGTGTVSVVGGSTAFLTNSGRMLDPFLIANSFNTTSSYTSYDTWSSSNIEVVTYSGAFDSGNATGNTSNFLQTFASVSTETYSASYGSLTTQTTATTGGIAGLTNNANSTIGAANNYTPVVVVGQATAGLVNSGTIYSGNIVVQALSFSKGCMSTYNVTFADNYAASSFTVFNTGNNTTQFAPGVPVSASSVFSFASAETSTSLASDSITYAGGNAYLTNTGVIDPVGGTISVIGAGSAALNNSGNITESDINVLSSVFNSANLTTTSATQLFASNENYNTTYTYVGNATITNEIAFGNLSRASVSSETIGQTMASSGGTALLNNTGFIVGGNSSSHSGPFVTVNGDTSATLINSGNIQPFNGNNTVGGVFVEVRSISGNQTLIAGCVSTHTFADSWTSNTVFVTTGNATPNYYASSVSTDAKSWLNSNSASFTSTTSTYAGSANLTNSGNIAGSVSVEAGASAVLTNSGFIGQSFGYVAVTAHLGTEAFGCATSNMNAGNDTRFLTLTGNASGNFTRTSAFAINEASAISGTVTISMVTGGGDATLVNSGVIGLGNKTTLISTAPMDVLVDAYDTASANNSGNIFGCLTVQASAFSASAVFSYASSEVSSSAENTYSTTSITGNLGNVVSQSWTSANSQNWSANSTSTVMTTGNTTGGVATLTNTGNITGDVGVFGGTTASVVNTKNGNATGFIAGNVNINATAWYTLSQTVSSGSDQGNTTFTTGTTSVTDTQSTKFNYATSYAGTSNSTSVENINYQNVTVSNATTASLVNDGIIGRSNAGVNVTVVADGTTASTINTGTIWGNLSVSALGFASADSYTESFHSNSAEASSYYLNIASGGNIVSGNVLIQAYASYTPNTSTAYSWQVTSGESDTFIATYNVTGGQGNIVNSGKIVGSVTVSGPGGATLTNSGNITGIGNSTSISFGSVDVSSTGANTFSITQRSSLDVFSIGSADARSQVQNLDAGGNVTSTVLTHVSTEAQNDSYTSVSSSTYTSVAAGSTAALVNTATGRIGVPNSNTTVDINVNAEGPAASFVNSGLVWANNINVIASMPSYSASSLEAFGSTYTNTSAESSTYINNSIFLPGNGTTILPSYTASATTTFAESGASSGTTQYTQSYMTLGGAASLVNNAGGVMIVESLTVSGDSTASFVNSGIIGPETSTGSHDYLIISDATNSVFHSFETFTSGFTDSATYNESASLSGTTLFMTQSSAGGGAASSASNESSTLSQFSSGGNASLVNNAGAVIGGFPVSVFVTADQTASVVNSGEIDGNVTAMGFGYSLTTVATDNRNTSSTATSSDMWTTITGNLVAANMSFTYNPTSVHMDSASAASNGAFSFVSVSNVVSGVGTLTNASGASITGNVTVLGPYGASLVNSGTIGGGTTSGGVIARELQVVSLGANVSYSDAGNFSGMSASSDNYSAARLLGSDANLTSTYSNIGGSKNSYSSFETSTSVSTQMGVGATLTNNSTGVIGSLVNPMTVVVEAVGPSTVINNGTIYGDVYIGQSTSGEPVNSSQTFVQSTFSSSATSFTDSWNTITSNLTGTPKTTPTSFANITTTNFTQSGSFSTAEVTSTVSSPASYSGSGNVYGGINLATSGNISFNNSGTIGSPFGGGSLEVVSSGSMFSFSSVETFTRSGNTTDANISPNGVTGTHTFTGMSSSTTVESSASATTVTGGTVSFNNSGTIGGNASNPIYVFVDSPSGSTATNSGTIFGDLQVESDFYNYSSADSITFGGNASTQIVTNYSGTKITSQSSTITNTPFYSATTNVGSTPIGGNTTVINSGTITGELIASSAKNVLVTNSGQIWQSVSLEATGDLDTTRISTATSAMSVDTSSSVASGNNTSVHVGVNSFTSIDAFTHVSSGGNATLINSGTIGLVVRGTNGSVSLFTTDPVDGDAYPNVTLTADQNANVTNTGNILGNVYEYVVGGNETSATTFSVVTSTTVTAITTTGVLAGAGSSATTVTVFSSVTNLNTSVTSVETGGTATLTNSGNIGQSFASSIKSGGCLTATGGVYLQGQKGATITNTGLIGGDAEATAAAFSASTSITSVETLTGTQTVIAINTSLTNTATTRSSSLDVFHYTSTSISVPTGGSATIINSGSIGIDELNSQEQPVGTGASIVASGQAGALINNSGVIQGRSIEAYSHFSTSSEMATDDGTLTTTFDSSIGGGTLTVGGTEVQTYTQTQLAGGGTATIINTGKMLSSSQLVGGTPVFGTLQVTADSYGNATVTNAKGALILGDVTALSGGNSTNVHSVTTTTFTPFGVGTQVTTYSASGNWSGGTALVDNSGNIGGFVGVAPHNSGTLVGGDVYASGFTAGIVINRAGAAILNNASADSSRQNYSLNSTTTTTGGATSSSSFTENVAWVGGVASLDNFGSIGGNADAGQLGFVTNFSDSSADSWGGVQFGNLTNEQGATVGGFVSANSLFIGVTNNNGNVSSPLYGGFANVTNKGIVGEGFYVTSLKGSTFFNAANAQVDANGDGDSLMLTVNGQNSFTNFGTVGSVVGGNIGGLVFGNALSLYVGSLLGIPSENSVVEFSGNTTAVNYGIITDDLIFTNVAQGELNPNNATGNATFTFGQGSVLTGDINDLADVPYGSTYANLTINFSGTSGIPGNATAPGGGIYQGNIWFANATNVTAPGRWILTGQNLHLGQTTINNPGTGGIAWLQIGTPLNYFLNNPGQLLDVILGQNLDPLQGLDPFVGNSAVNPALNSVLTPSLTSNLISAIKTNPIITGNISIGTNGGLEGQAVIIGGVSNSGYLLPGWMLPNNTNSTLVNLIANTNQILPGQFEISGNYTQASTGTFLTNFAPTINRPPATFVGTQAGPFAPASFWLSVSPFQVDHTPTANIVVDGSATVNGTVQVYVNTGGLYVNGDSRTIVYDVGNLTLGANATTTQSAPSQFVHFGLNTGNASVSTVAGNISYHTLNVVVQRTSYATAGNNANAKAVGVALDSAVPVVAGEISGANGFVFANITQFNNAQDMAGFLSDLDWRSGNLSNAAAILSDIAPTGYAAMLAIDTGAGFENQVNKHLLDNRGAGAQGDPLVSSFFQAYGLNQRVNSTDSASGLSGDTAGLAAGLDFQLTDAVTLGGAMGWSNTSLNGNHDFGGSMTAIQAGIYSTITMGQFYIDATVWENFVHGSMSRAEPMIDRSFNSSYKDDEFRANAELGYRFNFMDTFIDNLGVTPNVGFSYRGVNLGDFTESALAVSSLEVPDGALGVTVKTLNHDIMQPYLGVTADGLYRISPMVVMRPMIGVGVQFGTPANSILAQFQGGGMPFIVKGPQSNSAMLTPEAGLEFKIGPTYSLSFSYRGEFGNQYSQQGGWLTLRGTW